MLIYFITSNSKKFNEVKEFFKDVKNIQIKRINLDIPEIQSVEVKEIVKFKINYVLKNYNFKNFLVEDTGFYIKCLNYLPGPFIKWFLLSIRSKGLYDICNFYRNYKAEAKIALGLRLKNKSYIFEDSVKGKVVKPKKRLSNNKIWWDNIFMPEGFNRTFGEMSSEEKNLISHRGKALRKLKNFLIKIK
mgnify:CR=1 FL=1